jgi:hypothetical protein
VLQHRRRLLLAAVVSTKAINATAIKLPESGGVFSLHFCGLFQSTFIQPEVFFARM